MKLTDTQEKLKNKKPHQLDESDHEARWDAETLARAELIKADEARYKKAKDWAAVLTQKEQDEAKAMQKVAKKA